MFKACFCRIVENLSLYSVKSVKYRVISGSYRNSKQADENLPIFRQVTF